MSPENAILERCPEKYISIELFDSNYETDNDLDSIFSSINIPGVDHL